MNWSIGNNYEEEIGMNGDVFVFTFWVFWILEWKKFYECNRWIYGYPDERNLMWNFNYYKHNSVNELRLNT